MATNFRTIVRRKRDTLHLELKGEFDGSSALQLIQALLKNCGSASRVLIHTDGLSEVHPFGTAVFERHLPGKGKLKSPIIFTGEHAREIAPFSPKKTCVRRSPFTDSLISRWFLFPRQQSFFFPPLGQEHC